MDGVSLKPQVIPVRENAAQGAEVSAGSQGLSEAAVEFEAMFLGTVVNEMLKDSAPTTMNGGFGEEMFRSLLGNEIGRQIAEGGGVGIAVSVDQAIKAYGR